MSDLDLFFLLCFFNISSINISSVSLIFLCEIRDEIKNSRYYTHLFLSLWKIVVFMICIMVSLEITDNAPLTFVANATEAFGERLYKVQEVRISHCAI